jgi:polysaccharide deacetylase family protein (PEP-CTERM system associated)
VNWAQGSGRHPEPGGRGEASGGGDLLGITIEDYFHVGAFRRLIARNRWYRFESRLEIATRRTLDILDEYGARATFFTHGWIAERYPELLRTIADRGHEVGNSGYAHRGIRELSAGALVEEFARARELLEGATGRRVIGTRIPDWISPADLRVLDALADAGYTYDASLRVVGAAARVDERLLVPFTHERGGRTLHEFPVPVTRFAGFAVPIGGGNWFRQLPLPLLRRAVRVWRNRHSAPFSLYFQIWELDPDQPRISGASWLARMRHYRNLDRMGAIVGCFLGHGRYSGFAQYLGTPVDAARSTAQVSASWTAPALTPRVAVRPLVAVVIPCHNEAESLPYLRNTLASVSARLRDRYRLHYVFVDDGSSDGTYAAMQREADGRTDCTVVRHPVNRGVAHAILTGIDAAPSDLVCSIDADCTYDPHQLAELVEVVEQGASLVTASPYHPRGHVLHVPGWRLVLSRTLSRLYRRVLGSDLHTFTSCFRAYRRSALVGLPLRRHGFLGVAETLARLHLAGAPIAEVPATLEARLIGRSKMRVVPVILGHLRLVIDIVGWRARGRPGPGGSPDAARAAAELVNA